MARTIIIGDTPHELIGTELRVGDKAPGFDLLDTKLQGVSLSDYAGKLKLLSVTPSLDTSVCELQAKRLNDEAGKHGDAIAFLNISVDLPFALKRFEEHCGLTNARLLSDHKEGSFGASYGLMIADMRILARALIVLDREDSIRHIQVVPELGQHPDYDSALKALQEML